MSAREPQQTAGQYDQSALLRPRSEGDWLTRLASVRRMPLGQVSQCHSGPVSGSTFVSTLLRASLREREIEHVAKAIYLVRVAPRRFPRMGRVACSGSSQLRKGCHRRDHGARRIEGDMNARAHASGSLVCEVSSSRTGLPAQPKCGSALRAWPWQSSRRRATPLGDGSTREGDYRA